MTRLPGIFALTIFLTAILGTAAGSRAAEQSHIFGPELRADAIRAARTNGVQEELRLVYTEYEARKMDGRLDGGVKITVGIGTDYFYVDRENTRIIYDFKIRRMISVRLDEKSFRNDSLYLVAAFRRAELRNLRQMSKAFGAEVAKNLSRQIGDRFWRESSVGLTSSDLDPVEVMTKPVDGNTISLLYGGKIVARVTSSGLKFAPRQADLFSKFFRYSLPMHPSILKEISKNGHAPGEIWIKKTDAKGEFLWKVLVLEDNQSTKTDYPLPPSYDNELTEITGQTDAQLSSVPSATGEKPNFEWKKVGEVSSFSGKSTKFEDSPDAFPTPPGHSFEKSMLPIMMAAVTGTYGSGPTTVDQYLEKIDSASIDGKHFEAMTLLLEMFIQHGESLLDACDHERPVSGQESQLSAAHCKVVKRSLSKGVKDKRYANLMKAIDLEGKRKYDKAMTVLSKIRVIDISNPYVVDIVMANIYAKKKSNLAWYGFIRGIRGNPYVSNWYKDIGTYYLRSYEPATAWICFDLGRSLPNRPEGDLLGSITSMESKLVKDYPDFF